MSETIYTDVLIIGTGIAGLTSALSLCEKNQKVMIVTREKRPELTNTYWAQGGIIYSSPEPADQALLVEDIIRASSYSSSREAAELIASQSAEIVEKILLNKVKTDFNRNERNELRLTKEAAHSKERIIYNGDKTGKEIQLSLLNYLYGNPTFPELTFLTCHTAIDLITPSHHGENITQRYEENKVIGAYLFDQEAKRVKKVIAKYTILATGGVNAIYLHHSNAEGARGDGHAMAARAGAEVVNMEFIQFHPTTFYYPSSHRRFLISEALRGEGGRLLNSSGKRFMDKYHPDAELAPRDVVSRAILEEMILEKSECVYLDISHKESDYIKSRFPTIYDYCLDHKIDMTKEPIPVVPAAHYTCGGVKTNLKAQTNLNGLYAVGEVACTGLHGANRLASTSLLEGLTFGHLAAQDILSKISHEKFYDGNLIKDWVGVSEPIDLKLINQDRTTLKQTMWNYVGLSRSTQRLNRARAMILELQDEVAKFYRQTELHDELIGLRNSIEVSSMVVKASMKNKKSLGCFYLRD